MEVYGEQGVDALVEALGEKLGVTPETWRSYEEVGEMTPAGVLLRFIELTGAHLLWLLRGEGTKYREGLGPSEGEPGPDSSAAPSTAPTLPGPSGIASGEPNGRPPSAIDR